MFGRDLHHGLLVIRTHGTEAVVKIEHYAFKTRKTRPSGQ